ncbi:MAG: hypothetical protein ACPIOQ_83485, partial [Promethearchaeia archaeon]
CNNNVIGRAHSISYFLLLHTCTYVYIYRQIFIYSYIHIYADIHTNIHMQDAKDIAELVEGLRAHVDDHAAALAACQALARLTAGEQPKKAAAIVKAGGIEAVLAAGAKHAGSAQVAEQMCRVLRSLAYYSNDNRAAIAAAGGIEAVVRVMRKHQANAAVMQQACGALCNIGWSDEALQKRIKDAGAEPLVRAAVAAPDATDDTKEEGQMLLDKLGKV